MPLLRRLACLLLLLAMPAAARTPSTLTVFAAASLKESLDEVAADWSRRSGQQVLVSFAASSALANQIEQGAPADIFISADKEWMDYLQARGRIDARTRFDLAANRLVVIAPASSRLRTLDLARADRWRAALRKGRLAVAETAGVPAGRYARQALTRLGLWETVAPRLAQAENVRAAMAFVALGEAPLGIVYATDAMAEPKVRVVARLPAASHDPIVYPIARVAAADAIRASAFLQFLRSRPAQAIFRKTGFSQP